MISTILTSMIDFFLYIEIYEKVRSKSEKTVFIVVKLTGVEPMNYPLLDYFREHWCCFSLPIRTIRIYHPLENLPDQIG